MPLDEKRITEAIIKRYMEKLLESLSCDVAIVGGGPAGLVAAADLAGMGRTACLFERNLSVGGGMWGGGMMMNEIVVQEEGRAILEEFGVRTRPFGKGYFTADSIEAVSTICSRTIKAGARIFNLISVEDLMIRNKRATGLVINWTAVEMASLHVDPLTVEAKYLIDATGHAAELIRVIERKSGAKLMTPSGKVEGEMSLWAERAERTTIENTREVFPGVFVAGMCANAVFGSYRMGPIFGGMLLSGRKAARLIEKRLKTESRSRK